MSEGIRRFVVRSVVFIPWIDVSRGRKKIGRREKLQNIECEEDLPNSIIVTNVPVEVPLF
ncbi:unnamed protein product [Onchocerca flexuosa]|uniref:Uncharacterized protein n=1 Tax=Onchocerca flexuosa TaxID=387005 RepID=A0A183HW39_9BILA|nr:unnamed protein product [Onchocerca flexuosa]